MEELIARSFRAVCPGRLQKAAFFCLQSKPIEAIVYTQAVGESIRWLIHAIINLIARVEIRGLERKGTIAKGSLKAVRKLAKDILAEAPERFMLAADCTVPSETLWNHLKAAIEVAHRYQK